ncbi:MAG: hypothetical protein U0795_13025 [Pirellulales bacterium]
MKGFDFVSHAARIQRATKELRDHWEILGEVWHDGVQRRFEDRHLQPIQPQLQLAVTKIYEFAELVQQMAVELEEREA